MQNLNNLNARKSFHEKKKEKRYKRTENVFLDKDIINAKFNKHKWQI